MRPRLRKVESAFCPLWKTSRTFSFFSFPEIVKDCNFMDIEKMDAYDLLLEVKYQLLKLCGCWIKHFDFPFKLKGHRHQALSLNKPSSVLTFRNASSENIVHCLSQVKFSCKIKKKRKNSYQSFVFHGLSPNFIPGLFSSFPSTKFDLRRKRWVHLLSQGALLMFELWHENCLWAGFSTDPPESSRVVLVITDLEEGNWTSEGSRDGTGFPWAGSWANGRQKPKVMEIQSWWAWGDSVWFYRL